MKNNIIYYNLSYLILSACFFSMVSTRIWNLLSLDSLILTIGLNGNKLCLSFKNKLSFLALVSYILAFI